MLEETEKELQKPLLKENVKIREQPTKNGAIKLSYVESHHVIREANRIFGHFGWSSTIRELSCVASEEKRSLQYVSYTCHVTVTCHGTERSDIGFGQGINNDAGKAHESAVKEAVSDAQKRCLRTFGDQFGLALYDKSMKNVVPEHEKELTREQAEDLELMKEVMIKCAEHGNRDAALEEYKNIKSKYGEFGDKTGIGEAKNKVAKILSELGADNAKET